MPPMPRTQPSSPRMSNAKNKHEHVHMMRLCLLSHGPRAPRFSCCLRCSTIARNHVVDEAAPDLLRNIPPNSRLDAKQLAIITSTIHRHVSKLNVGKAGGEEAQ